MDCSLPGSSIHGIFQARVLEWIAISFSRSSSQTGDWTWVSHIVGRCFTIWATREVLFPISYLLVSFIFVLPSHSFYYHPNGASLVAQTVQRLPTMQETRVWSLGWEDPPEKEIAAHSSILVWRIPWTEDPGGLQSMGSQRVRHDWATSLHLIENCRYLLPHALIITITI